MESGKLKAVVGFFSTKAQAESATDELWHAGFRHDQIGMAVPGGQLREATTGSAPMEEKAAAGTTKGAVTGGVLGAAAGITAAALVPGVGPILAGALLIGGAVGAATGAAVGTFAGPFLAMGFSEEEARHLGDEIKGGRTVLVVRPDDLGQAEKTVEVVRSHGGQLKEQIPVGAQ